MISIGDVLETPRVLDADHHQKNHEEDISKCNEDAKQLAAAGEFKKITIKEELYRKYKFVLHTLQYGKCAFCESKRGANECQVEHFRPKKFVRLDDGKEDRSRYFWLAYCWRNFLVSCGDCNRPKANNFPLELNSAVVDDFNIEIAPDGSLGGERPMFINPRYEDPEEHFSYESAKMNEPEFKLVFIRRRINGLNDRAKITIKALDLNRRDTNQKYAQSSVLHFERGRVLSGFRKDAFKYLEAKKEYEKCVRLTPSNKEQKELAAGELKERVDTLLLALQNSAQFAGMKKYWLFNDMGLDTKYIEELSRKLDEKNRKLWQKTIESLEGKLG